MNKIQRPAIKPVYRALPPRVGVEYLVRRVRSAPRLLGDLTKSPWSNAGIVDIAHFHPKSSDHRPKTQVRALYTGDAVFVDFSVADRFVRCVHTAFQDLVSKDSCVELFLQPPGTNAYFNFELNCCGTMLLYFIEDPTRHATKVFRKATRVSSEAAAKIRVRSTLTGRVDPERTEPTSWRVGLEIPIAIVTEFVPIVRRFDGEWRGNFFKCGDDTSHPHWAAWNDIGETLRFHQPRRFAPIRFE